MKSNDPFWTENFTILFSKSRIHEFWPAKQLSFYEKANAITRFLLYSGILISFANKSSIHFLYSLLLIILLSIVVLRKSPPPKSNPSKSNNIPELQKMNNNQQCTKPTRNNPFGNVLMNEYQDNPQRSSACNTEDVRSEIKNNFLNDFIQDPFDIYNKKHSQRQFFSTANTQIPNNQSSFAHWLYGQDGYTCKENALSCKGNEAFGG
tara:strand:- start:516 stop:1136 length:621 start_codon:yes stop_codon:yes gene_type:complete